ncbi:MAG: TetR family transcriptional regulator, partial [Roseomonas sp.]|nr:TetR family transcriptional regulator [Roseomonas sp.]
MEQATARTAKGKPGAAPLSARAAATRQRILDAALVEFAANGLAGARVGELAARAGASPRLGAGGGG